MANMDVWAIYDHPADFPRHFVVRAWMLRGRGRTQPARAILADTIDAARAEIPRGRVRLPAMAGDDPSLCETWV